MRNGYLFIETNLNHPGMVRICKATRDPTSTGSQGLTNRGDTRIRLVLRFNDLDAARMHAHTALRHNLIDVDSGTYRATLIEAIAALDAIQLEHRPIYRDPEISNDDTSAIESLVAARHKQQALQDRFWQIVGGLGIGLLAFSVLGY